ncbi:MAG: ParB/RepB/Spo0J family partition protein [Alkalispirochaeta sp.]
MSKQRRLGKGIDALLQGRDITQLESGDLNSVVSVPLDRIRPNPDQPRKSFAPEALEELARSIEERGIIQPILAEQQDDDTFIIIAGERRYRAAKMAGLTVVPVLPGVFSEDEKLEIALIENVQRQDLTAIEEARAYRDLMNRLGLSQDELAQRLGRSRPAVANSLRLLRLPEAIHDRINAGAVSGGHARTLLGIENPDLLVEAAELIESEGLSVRVLERIVPLINQGNDPATALARVFGAQAAATSAPVDSSGEPGTPASSPGSVSGGSGRGGASSERQAPRKTVEMQEIEQKLIERLGTRVVLTGTNDRGKIEITYLSMDDLDRLMELLLDD